MTQRRNVDALLSEWDGRPSMALVVLDQLSTNVQALRHRVGSDTRFMAVVKAEGYGHGAVPIAKTAVRAGADEVAVATVEEGVRLRRGGVTAPILVLGPIGTKERPRAIAFDLMLVIGDPDFVRGLAADVRKTGRKTPLDVHLKVDTGMHRFGVCPERAVGVAKVIDAVPELRLAGVMTHFASADDPDAASTHMQAAMFDEAVAAIRAAGIEVSSEHLCNSAATLRYPEYHRDRVRVGISMYGLRPDPELVPVPDPIRPIMSVHSRITRIEELQPGERVSYGGTWQAEAPSHVALVPIGYADGYSRQGSNRAWVDVRGQRSPVRGRVCMDQTMVEVGPDARSGDIVTVIGDGQHGEAPSIDELAVLWGTISHEVATGFAARRLGHLYLQGGRLVAVADLWDYREIDEDAFAQPEIGEQDTTGVAQEAR
ncbi:MAG TPA: alanine racemase [Thermomicrobiales bacterium]|nr:alanine racemase [Thermomicrobiales bacterium]